MEVSQAYIVIKDFYVPYRDDLPHDEYVLIDCIKVTEDGALERIKELAREGYRNADYKKFNLR